MLMRRIPMFWGVGLLFGMAGCAAPPRQHYGSQAQPVTLFDYEEPRIAAQEIAARRGPATPAFATEFEEAVVRDWLYDYQGDGAFRGDQFRRRRTILRVGRWRR